MLGIFPKEKIYKDYYQLSDQEIEDLKDTLKKEMNDPVFSQQQGMGAPMGGGMAPPPPPPAGEAGPGMSMDSDENIPPTQAESLDIGSMKQLALEAGCDDELLKLLEEMDK